jgi:hypothetical protein
MYSQSSAWSDASNAPSTSWCFPFALCMMSDNRRTDGGRTRAQLGRDEDLRARDVRGADRASDLVFVLCRRIQSFACNRRITVTHCSRQRCRSVDIPPARGQPDAYNFDKNNRPRVPSSPSHTRAPLRRTRRCSSCIVTSMSAVLASKKRGDAPKADAGHTNAVIEGVVRNVDGGHGCK